MTQEASNRVVPPPPPTADQRKLWTVWLQSIYQQTVPTHANHAENMLTMQRIKAQGTLGTVLMSLLILIGVMNLGLSVWRGLLAEKRITVCGYVKSPNPPKLDYKL
jgi:hypothetical protein